MLKNSEIRAAARETLDEKGWPALATLVLAVVNIIATSGNNIMSIFKDSISELFALVGLCLMILVYIPMFYGYYNAFLPFNRDANENKRTFMKNMFSSFHDGSYGRSIGLTLLTALFVVLWCILLIIPGIIMAYAYRMAFYISRDNPELSVMECLSESRVMMRGYKWKMFLLDLSFIGWALLCVLTAGIGYLWLQPYMFASSAKFYDELKKEVGTL